MSHPAWSPDGRWIAAASGDGELWIVDTAADKAQVVNGLVLDDEALLWRPLDGRQLAVVARESLLNRLRFALVTPGVDKHEFLAPVGYLGSQFRAGGWTPDGSRFVYASDPPWGQVHVVEVDGGRDVQIQPSIEGNGTIYPRLSNDGRRVLFMEQGAEGKSWLSVAPSDGSKAGDPRQRHLRRWDRGPLQLVSGRHDNRVRAQRRSQGPARSRRRSPDDAALDR